MLDSFQKSPVPILYTRKHSRRMRTTRFGDHHYVSVPGECYLPGGVHSRAVYGVPSWGCTFQGVYLPSIPTPPRPPLEGTWGQAYPLTHPLEGTWAKAYPPTHPQNGPGTRHTHQPQKGPGTRHTPFRQNKTHLRNFVGRR